MKYMPLNPNNIHQVEKVTLSDEVIDKLIESRYGEMKNPWWVNAILCVCLMTIGALLYSLLQIAGWHL